MTYKTLTLTGTGVFVPPPGTYVFVAVIYGGSGGGGSYHGKNCGNKTAHGGGNGGNGYRISQTFGQTAIDLYGSFFYDTGRGGKGGIRPTTANDGLPGEDGQPTTFFIYTAKGGKGGKPGSGNGKGANGVGGDGLLGGSGATHRDTDPDGYDGYDGYILIKYETRDLPPPPPPPTTPTYSLSRSASSIRENDSVSFTLSTRNVSSGTLVPYQVTGINASDLVSGNLSGNFVVGSLTTVSFTTRADLTTEGSETLTLTLVGLGISSSCTIIDSSQTPVETYSLTRSASAVNEGDAISFTLTTTGISNGTSIGYQITGVGSSDINDVLLTGSFVIQSGVSTIGFNITPDLLMEGTETLLLSLTNGKASISVDIIDTSLPLRHTYIKHNGDWKEAQKIFIKQNNQWIPIRRVYTKVGGTWRLVFNKETWSTILSTVDSKIFSGTWYSQAQCTLTATFASAADARYFFNSGSKIRFSSSREGGDATLQNGAWTNLLNSVGVRSFGGYWKEGFNFYNLKSTYQTFYSQIASVPYSTNFYRIEALCNVADNSLGTANQITFRITWRDDYGISGIYGPETGVSGSLRVFVEELKAVAPSLEPTVLSPSYVLSAITAA